MSRARKSVRIRGAFASRRSTPTRSNRRRKAAEVRRLARTRRRSFSRTANLALEHLESRCVLSGVGLTGDGGTGVFVDQQQWSVESTVAIGLGDIDGDGDLDILSSTSGNTVSNPILLNDGSGNFTLSPHDLGSDAAESIAIGDLDGDGDLDAALVGRRTYGVQSIWLNDGSGQFTAKSQTIYGLDVALGDLDGDGDLDLFAAHSYDLPKVWMNDGVGNFTAGATVPGSENSTAVALGDVDSDGDLDALVGNYRAPNRIYLNDGLGTFTNSGQSLSPPGFESSPGTHDVALGDLDGDGDLDAYAANGNFAERNLWWLNDGAGTFATRLQAPIASVSTAVALGDLDGDGDLDVMVGNDGNYSNEATYAYSNDGAALFTRVDTPLAQGLQTRDLALGDLDGDGDLDLVTASFGAGSGLDRGIHTWANADVDLLVQTSPTEFRVAPGESELVTWEVTVRNAGQYPTAAATIVDTFSPHLSGVELLAVIVSGEGTASTAVAGARSGSFTDSPPIGVNGSVVYRFSGTFTASTLPAASEAIHVATIALPPGIIDVQPSNNAATSYNRPAGLLGGTGLFAEAPHLLSDVRANGVELADVDQDGDLDAFVANENSGNTIWVNDGTGYFVLGQTLPAVSSSESVSLGDLDGDGDVDAFVRNRTTSTSTVTSRVWLNGGSGTFVDSGQAITGGREKAAGLADMDGDGDLDIVLSHDNGGVEVWTNAGDGNFSLLVAMPGDDRALDLKLGDLDGDGDIDAVVAYQNTSNRVWLNDGSGNVSLSPQLFPESGSHGLDLGDMDGDGDVDIVAIGAGDEYPSRVWLNDGAGEFSTFLQFSVVGWAVDLADLDGDGDLDAAIANNTSTQAFWINDGSGRLSPSVTYITPMRGNGVTTGDIDGDGDNDAIVVSSSNSNRIFFNADAELAVQITPSTTHLSLGQTTSVVYEVKVSNLTNRDVVQASVSHALHAALQNATLTTVTLTPGASSSSSLGPVPSAWSDTVTLPAGGSVVYRILADAVVPLTGAVSILYNATVTAPPGMLEYSTSNNSARTSNSTRLEAEGIGRYVPGGHIDRLEYEDRIELGDLDGDGDLDAFVGSTAGMHRVLLNDSEGTFVQVAPAMPRFDTAFSDDAFEIHLVDIDLDGDLDAVVTTPGVQVLLNDGQGRFTAGPTWILGIHDAELADFDGDGDLDLMTVATSFPGSGNALYLNDGYGRFSESPNLFPQQTSILRLDSGDFDGDGDIDLLTIESETVRQWTNDGTGVFVLAPQQLPTNQWPLSTAVGDLDNDGDLDLVVNARQGNDQVWLNDGTGVFAPGQKFTFASFNGTEVQLADMDGDGDLDVLIRNEANASPLIQWTNNGAASFVASVPISTLQTLDDFDLGDLDGDGDVDIIGLLAYPGTGPTMWLNADTDLRVRVSPQTEFAVGTSREVTYTVTVENPAQHPVHGANLAVAIEGVFSNVQLVAITPSTGATSSLVAGPVGATLLDTAQLPAGSSIKYELRGTLTVPPSSTGSVRVIGATILPPEGVSDYNLADNSAETHNTNDQLSLPSAGQFLRSDHALAGFYGHALAVADFNRDGFDDLVVGSNGPTSVVMLSDGAGNFVATGQLLAGGPAEDVTTADVDNDGDFDIILAHRSFVRIWLNDGEASFGETGQSFTGANLNSIEVADLDADGDADLVVGGATVTLWKNDGHGLYVASGNVGETGASDIEAGDVDGDGDLDLLVVGSNSSRIWLNDGAARFSTAGFTFSSTRTGGVLGDFDGDGDLDAAILASGSQVLWINNGAGVFTNPTGTFVNGQAIEAIDLEGDGDLDLIIGVSRGSTSDPAKNFVLVNRGNGTFTRTNGDFGVGTVEAIAVGDFDGDHDQDFVLSDNNSTHVRLYSSADTDILVQVTPSSHDVPAGTSGPISYQLKIANTGPRDATQVAINDLLSPWISGAAITSIVKTDGVTNTLLIGAIAGQLSDMASIPAGGSITYTIQGMLTVPADQPSLQTHVATAVVTSGVVEASLANNRAEGLNTLAIPTPVSSAIFVDTAQRILTYGRHVALGDLDGDGDVDAFVAGDRSDSQQRNTVLLNDGHGNYEILASFGLLRLNFVTLADIDSDGDLDAVGITGDSEQIWLNNGDAGFELQNTAYFDRPLQIAFGDLDGDGDLDAFVARGNNVNTFSNLVYRNDGTGRFVNTGQTVGNTDTRFASLADFDGDGDLDAMVASRSPNPGNRIWVNNGSGTFTNLGLAFGTGNTHTFLAADFNNDGLMDLVEGNDTGASVVRLASRSGFAARPLPISSTPDFSMRVGDLDGDGDLDLLLIGSDRVMLNDGQGNFTLKAGNIFSTGSRPAALADLDGDGDLDAYLVGATNQRDQIWLNAETNLSVRLTPSADVESLKPGDTIQYTMVVENTGPNPVAGATLALHLPPQLTTAQLTSIVGTVGASSGWTAASALGSGDNFDTIAIPVGGTLTYQFTLTLSAELTNYPSPATIASVTARLTLPTGEVDSVPLDNIAADHNVVALRTSRGTGTLESTGQSLGTVPSYSVVLGDLDGDGDLDAVVAEDGTVPSNRVWLNDGAGSMIDSGQVLGDFSSTSVTLGDIDGDGDLDVFIANRDYAGLRPTLYLNNGDAQFTQADRGLLTRGTRFVSLVDINSDGALDATIDSAIYLNNGLGYFTLSDQTVAERPTYGDVDGDGDLDVLYSNRLKINRGDGVFNTQVAQIGSNSSDASALFDADGDGDLDALLSQGSRIKVWLNNGSGTFTDSGQSLSTVRANNFVVGDVDADGDLDFLMFSGESGLDNKPELWLNNSSGVFTKSEQVFNVRGAGNAALGDLDGDGDLDAFVVSKLGANQIWLNAEAETQVDLRVEHHSTAVEARPGAELEFVFTVHNDGPNPATDASVRYLIPQYFQDVELLAVTVSGVASSSLAVGPISGQTLNDSVDLAVGSAITYRVRGRVAPAGSPGLPATHRLQHSVFVATSESQIDPFTANNQAVDVDLVAPYASSGSGLFFELPQLLTTVDAVDVALGDLDGDGDLDAVVAYEYSAPEVLMNDGTGRFTVVATLLREGANPQTVSVAIADTDNDGDLDVALINYWSYDSLWVNNGSGDFSQGPELPHTTNNPAPGWLQFVDADADGDLDYLTSSELFLNQGANQFVDTNRFLPSHVNQHAFGDLDGDGDLDAMSSDYYLRNDGAGGFVVVGSRFTDTSSPWALGDLDGDGDLDAVRGMWASQEVWLNPGNGVLQFHSSINTAPGASQVRLVDVDADGDLDNIALERDSNLHVWINDGNAQFSDTGLRFGATDVRRFSIGDLDGDGDLDAITVGESTAQVWTNLSASELTDVSIAIASTTASTTTGGHLVYTVTASNLSQVGVSRATVTAEFLQQVAGARVTSASVVGGAGGLVPLGSFSGVFTAEVNLPAGASLSFVIEVDLLASGSANEATPYGLVLATSIDVQGLYDSAPGNNKAYDINVVEPGATRGTGRFSAFDREQLQTNPSDIALGDVDGDGDLDALVVFHDGDGVLQLNDGSGNFSPAYDFAGPGTYTDRRTGLLADYDGDGDLDAFVRTQWYFNDGLGGFSLAPYTAPASAVFGDLDGDGDLDAIAEGRVRLNDGTGVLVASGPSVGSRGIVPQLGDVDRDGDLDVFIGGGLPGQVVWLNNGQGVFTATTQQLETNNVRGFDLGDLDGDGDLDAWIITEDFNRIYRNDGNGNFTALPQQIPRTNFNSIVALADIDGDGDLDAVTSVHDLRGSHSLFLNNGNATFVETTSLVDYLALGVIAVGDLDNDGDVDAVFGGSEQMVSMLNGDVDLAVSLESPGTDVNEGDTKTYHLTVTNSGPIAVSGAALELLFNRPLSELEITSITRSLGAANAGASVNVGGGKLSDLVTLPVGGTITYVIRAVVGDVDDANEAPGGQFVARATIEPPTGLFDAVPENSFAQQQDLLRTVSDVPTGIWVDSGQQLLATGGLSVATGDLDGDGDADLILGHNTGSQIWWNQGGVFVAGPTITTANARAVAMADLDNDGDLDVAVSAYAGPVFYRNDGAGNLTQYFNLSFRETSPIEFADIDGDGYLDLFIGATWLNDGTGSFFRALNAEGGDTRNAFGDLNNDGSLDRLNPAQSYRNLGRGVFGPIAPTPSDSGESYERLGDLDGDGDLDAVVANNGSNRVWLNNGSGVFQDTGQRLGRSQFSDLKLADFDRDGDLDALFASTSGKNELWLNNGQGTFTFSGIEFDAGSTNAMAISDFNGDGTLDVVTVNGNGPTRLYTGVDIRTQPDLLISATAQRSEAELGQPHVYTVFVSNNGLVPINGAQVSVLADRLIGSLQVTAIVATGGASHSVNVGGIGGRELQDSVNLPAGSTLTYTVVVNPDPQAPFLATDGVIQLRAEATVPDGFVSDITPANNVAVDTDRIVLPNVAGTGQFVTRSFGRTADRINDVQFADVDGDGDLDAIVARGVFSAGNPANNNTIWLNDGIGNFVDSGQVLGNNFTRSIALGDWDTDGDIDILFGNDGVNELWLNDGHGIFVSGGQPFGPQSNTTRDIQVGDFDGDGDLDAFELRPDFEILWLNDGSGHFVSRTIDLPFEDGGAIETGDFNGDGYLDIVRLGVYGNMHLLLNDGRGNFVFPDSPIAQGSFFVFTIGDLDQDGDLDIVRRVDPPTGTDRLEILRNDGRGNFTAYGSQLTGGNMGELLLLDVDSDGDLDIVGSLENTSATTRTLVWSNDGTGRFGSSRQIGPNQSGYYGFLAAGDIDRDGDPDLLVASENGIPAFLFNSNPVDVAVAIEAGTIVAGLGDTVQYRVTVTNQGSTPIHSVNLYSALPPRFSGGKVLDVSFSGEGRSHIAEGSIGTALTGKVDLGAGASVSLLLEMTIEEAQLLNSHSSAIATLSVRATLGAGDNTELDTADNVDTFHTFIEMTASAGHGSFVNSAQQLGFGVATDVTLGDLDGDGDLDAFVANRLTGNTVWRNNGRGMYENTGQSLGTADTFGVALADITGDGRLDAVVVNRDQSLEIWRNLGTGQFALHRSYPLAYDFRDVAIADLDNDGLLDIFIATGSGGYVWQQNSAGVFEQRGASLGTSTTTGVALGDLDGDGDIDAITSHSVGVPNKVWINNGSAQFTPTAQSLGTSDSVRVALADLDGDGDLDALVANRGSAHHVWTNNGSANFQLTQSIANTATAFTVALGDVDGDGDIDAAVGNVGTTGTKLWLNQGNAAFVDSQLQFGSSTTLGLALGDLDNDGDLDLVQANAFGSGNQVWRNQLSAPAASADFNGDGVVNLADYTVWRDNLNTIVEQAGTAGDADGNGFVDSRDYAIWKANYGMIVPQVPTAVTPPAKLATQESQPAPLASRLTSSPATVAATTEQAPSTATASDALATTLTTNTPISPVSTPVSQPRGPVVVTSNAGNPAPQRSSVAIAARETHAQRAALDLLAERRGSRNLHARLQSPEAVPSSSREVTEAATDAAFAELDELRPAVRRRSVM